MSQTAGDGTEDGLDSVRRQGGSRQRLRQTFRHADQHFHLGELVDIGAAKKKSRLPTSFTLADGGNGLDARKHHPPISTIRRTGRLLAPSMPVSSSTLPAFPPQPSWRMRARMSRSVRSRHAGVRLVDHLHLAAAVALDPQEPRRERPERLGQRFGGRGQRVVAVAAPVPLRKLGHGLPAQRTVSRQSRVGGIASPAVLLQRQSGASPNLPCRRFTVTIADFWSSFAGGGTSSSGLCFPTLGSARRWSRPPAPPAGAPSASAAGACSGRSR